MSERVPGQGECDCCGGAHWSCECISQPAYDEGYSAALAVLNAGLEAMVDRYEDLRHCAKDDDCQVKADAVMLAIDDFNIAVRQASEPLP